MLTLFAGLKCSKCIVSVVRTSYHTSCVNFKWPSVLKPSGRKRTAKKDTIKIWEDMTLWDLARSLKQDLNYVEDVLKPRLGPKLDPLSGQIKDFTSLSKFLEDGNYEYTVILPPTKKVEIQNFVVKPRSQRSCSVTLKKNEVIRPPVVTIMGHVDHGKTTLLDALRNSNIVAGEFGGITQHIGAFSVTLKPGKSVTFIDTPGHAAFTAMRSRGAEATDIVVLIIAADDGVMEQTVESIKMAKNAGVRIIVAVNKIDKASNNLESIKNQLLMEGIQAEDLGGDVQVVPISALKRKNLDLLIDAILLEAEVMGLTGDPKSPVEGVVIESLIGPRGKTATVLVKRGTLRKRTVLIAGSAMAKVRGMYDPEGRELSEVTLSQPAQVIGWRDLPNAGEIVTEVSSEKEARVFLKDEKKISMQKKMMEDFVAIQEKSVQERAEFLKRKSEIQGMVKEGDVEGLKGMYLRKSYDMTIEFTKLDIIVKGDVDGSVDAILDVVGTYDCDDVCKLRVVNHGVGGVTHADVELASTFDATIYCFNLNYPHELKNEILEKKIRIRFHNIIYKFIDDLKSEITELLPAQEEEEIIGKADVLENFMIEVKRKKIPVAGCMCVTGELRKDSEFKLVRNEETIHVGKLKSLKHFKNEVNTIQKDNQCGIMFADFSDEFQPGDKIICYKKILIQHPLSWNPGF